MNKQKLLTSYFDSELKFLFTNMEEQFFNQIEEIRIRANNPIIIIYRNKEFFLDKNGKFTDDETKSIKVTVENINKTIELISNHSIYAFGEELKSGYITITGGHRIGITGKTIIENGQIKTIKNINGLNIRIATQIKGCAKNVLNKIIEQQVLNTLIISPPGCGKTTLLRDIIRQISNGIPNKLNGQAVGVVDERSEIAGCYRGIPQNDLGIRTDILDSCPKAEGMIMLLRSMAPKVIAVDEIGNKKDVEAIEDILNAGVKLICTMHGYSIDDVKKRTHMGPLINKKVFDRYVVLKNTGSLQAVYNKDFENIA